MNEMHPRIFVNIAAYRDRDCVNTIEDLFAKAKRPERLVFGVCWQSLSPDDDEVDPLGRHAGQCRILRFDVSEAEGACWARHHTQKLWQGEEYVLQIDSHMRFVEHWDEKVLAMLAQCPSDRPILSNYPAAFTPPDQIDSHVVSVINAAGFDGDGVMKLGSEGRSPEHVPDSPQPSAFIGAGFVFGPSAWIADVPYDPYLYFQGEEITLAVRLFTAGWDIYCPSDVLAYHDYNARPDRPRHWVDRRDWPALNKRSVQRVRHLLGMEESRDPDVLREIGRYGLGSRRGLADYEALTGINFRARTINGLTTAQIEAQQPPDQKRKRTADAFTALWRDNGWGCAETRSGSGSTLAATETLRANFSELCRFLGVRQLIDAGCGDLNWMQTISAQFELYLGLDVVPGLIAETEQRFGLRRGHFFALRDVALDDLPRADAILCRDVLTHLSDEQVVAAIGRFKDSGSRYLFATTQPGNDHKDILTGDWRAMDLTREPFDLPPPILTIDECGDGSKLLGVWALKDLPERYKSVPAVSQKPPAAKPVETVKVVEGFETFGEIYARNAWGSQESVSGPGSTIFATEELRAALPEVFRRYGIRSVLDAGCGDLNWMRHLDYRFDRYIGIDVVESLVASHARESWPPGYEFRFESLTGYAGPALDAVFSRDVLVHLPDGLVRQAIARWVSLGFRYLCLTSFPRAQSNPECAVGGWRPLNLQLAPFNLPEPEILIPEGSSLEGTGFSDKSIGVWDCSALSRVIADW